MAAPQDVDAEGFQGAVLEQAGAVLVDFWSPTCPHCRQFAPAFAAAADTGREGVSFAKVSAEDGRPLFVQYEISAVPTLLLFREGKEVARQAGAKTAEEVLAWLGEQL